LRVLAGQARGVGCAWAGLVGEDWLVGRVLFVCGVCGWLCVRCAQWLCWGWVCVVVVVCWGCCAWVLGVVCGCVALVGGMGLGSCCVCLCVDIFPVYL